MSLFQDILNKKGDLNSSQTIICTQVQMANTKITKLTPISNNILKIMLKTKIITLKIIKLLLNLKISKIIPIIIINKTQS